MIPTKNDQPLPDNICIAASKPKAGARTAANVPAVYKLSAHDGHKHVEKRKKNNSSV
ncbi:hypothetical protein [Herbaspirillum autotrophicum]|uniref:hypothetical protein n=1 Tax=Herbaspirillum autotrophicum TaxID=180195 RepID=UPI000A5304EE|nr:hypothetical protein [Herbaspirillum autotrophicum]